MNAVEKLEEPTDQLLVDFINTVVPVMAQCAAPLSIKLGRTALLLIKQELSFRIATDKNVESV